MPFSHPASATVVAAGTPARGGGGVIVNVAGAMRASSASTWNDLVLALRARMVSLLLPIVRASSVTWEFPENPPPAGRPESHNFAPAHDASKGTLSNINEP
jgi:hypothetical protein